MAVTTNLDVEILRSEFTVNESAGGNQSNYDAAALNGGGFVISYGDVGGPAFARELGADGTDGALKPLLDENNDQIAIGGVSLVDGSVQDFPLMRTVIEAVYAPSNAANALKAMTFGTNTFQETVGLNTVGTASGPDAARLSNGQIVSAYSNNGNDVRFVIANTGQSGSGPFGTNQFVESGTGYSLDAGANGFFVSYVQGPPFTISGTPIPQGNVGVARFDNSGVLQGSIIDAGTNVYVGDYADTEILALPDGGFALAYIDEPGLVLKIFDASGNNVTPNNGLGMGIPPNVIVPSLGLSGSDSLPSLSLIGDGLIAVSWTLDFNDSGDLDVWAAIYDVSGDPVVGRFAVDASSSDESDSTIAGSLGDDGLFVTSYTDETADASGDGVSAVVQQIVRRSTGDGAADDFPSIVPETITDAIRDIQRGGGGADFMLGGRGRDDVFGEGGDDIINLRAGDNDFGSEVINGGDGTDTLRMFASEQTDVVFDLRDDDVSAVEKFAFFSSPSDNTQSLSLRVNLDQLVLDPNSGQRTAEIETSALDALALTLQIDTNGAPLALPDLTFDSGFGLNDSVVVNGTANNEIIVGTGATDTINGGGGRDIISATAAFGGNLDTLVGGTGDDVYNLNGFSAFIVEEAGEGTDTVRTDFATYVLGANVENLQRFGDTAFTAFGNELDNAITGAGGVDELSGEGGNDTLDGMGGADTMRGGTGDDTYEVSEVGDQVIENAGEGFDVVRTSAGGLTLAANVEQAVMLDAAGGLNGDGTSGILSGNAISNLLTGNSLGNFITGNGGSNLIYGAGGNDQLRGGTVADLLDGQDGNDALLGGAGSDILFGNAGNDILDGAAGIDALYGSIGNDTFRVGQVGFGEQDTIFDFGADGEGAVGPAGSTGRLHDVIGLQAFNYGALGADVEANEFVSGSSSNVGPTLARAQLIYETDTGRLLYDSDGTGAGAAFHILNVQFFAGGTLGGDDFDLV